MYKPKFGKWMSVNDSLPDEQFNDSWDDGVRYAVEKIREVIE